MLFLKNKHVKRIVLNFMDLNEPVMRPFRTKVQYEEIIANHEKVMRNDKAHITELKRLNDRLSSRYAGDQETILILKLMVAQKNKVNPIIAGFALLGLFLGILILPEKLGELKQFVEKRKVQIENERKAEKFILDEKLDEKLIEKVN